MLTLFQAEWCPFSSSVREALTERGIDFVARQVPPYPEERAELAARAGTDEIPVLEAESGEIHAGTRAIFAYLVTLETGPYSAEHRRRYREHEPARRSGVAGTILERAAPLDGDQG